MEMHEYIILVVGCIFSGIATILAIKRDREIVASKKRFIFEDSRTANLRKQNELDKEFRVWRQGKEGEHWKLWQQFIMNRMKIKKDRKND